MKKVINGITFAMALFTIYAWICIFAVMTK